MVAECAWTLVLKCAFLPDRGVTVTNTPPPPLAQQLGDPALIPAILCTEYSVPAGSQATSCAYWEHWESIFMPSRNAENGSHSDPSKDLPLGI